MDIKPILFFFRDLFLDLFGVLESIQFDVNGIHINYSSLVLAFLVIGLIVAVFWKGART